MLIEILADFLKIIFDFTYNITNSYGISLVLLSIFVNLILLPVYYPIEKIKEKNRLKEKDMAHEIDEIKQVYFGQERYYYVNAIHRQYKYNPLRSLIPSLGLLIQIPFFMAAYKMLSHYVGFSGVSFGFIKDLAAPDAGLNLGYSMLNILPVIMTVINLISSLLYTKDGEKKEMYQLWGLAGLFLILLYNSPSALVLYWTMNNVFALVKQVWEHKRYLPRLFRKYKISLDSIYKLSIIIAMFLGVSILGHNDGTTMTPLYLFVSIFITLGTAQFIGIRKVVNGFKESKRKKILLITFIALLVPQSLFLFIQVGKLLDSSMHAKSALALAFFLGLGVLVSLPYYYKVLLKDFGKGENKKLPVILSIFIVTLALIWLPIQVYASMPARFTFGITSLFTLNIDIVLISIAVLIGLYFILPKKFRGFYTFLLTLTAMVAFIYSFVVRLSFGSLDGASLTNSDALVGTYLIYVLEFIFLYTVVKLVYKLYVKRKDMLLKIFIPLYLLICIQGIYTALPLLDKKLDSSEYDNKALSFSKDKENVVVLMLDMFQGSYPEEIFNSNPELKETYRGFTWFPNTLTTSYYTNSALPGIIGGWDFSPQEINKDKDKILFDKISQSYIYAIDKSKSRGFDTSVVNPVYFKSALGKIEELKKLGANVATNSSFRELSTSDDSTGESSKSQGRLLASVGLFRAVPYLLKPRVYNKGSWFNLEESNYKYVSDNVAFIKALSTKSNIGSSNSTYKIFNSEITHTPFGITKDGEILNSGNADKDAPNSVDGLNSYYSAYWSLVWIGDFLNWLRDNDIYDNTRVIVVSDHGNAFDNPYKTPFENLDQLDNLGAGLKKLSRLNPLLLVKDFNSNEELNIDNSLMSNADVHNISFDGLDSIPVEENRILETIILNKWKTVELETTNTFEYKYHYRVEGSLIDLNNWDHVK